MLKKLWGSIKKNHIAQMALCCLLPVLIIIGLKLFGLTGFWVYTIAIAACVGSHLVMTYFASKGEKTCH